MKREDDDWKCFLGCVVDAEACSVADSLSGTWWSGLTQGATSLSEKLVWLEMKCQSPVGSCRMVQKGGKPGEGSKRAKPSMGA